MTTASDPASADLTALLMSRVAHDLAGPLGAVSNGLELMEALGADAGPDATDLMRQSLDAARHRLALFRAAFGAPGQTLEDDDACAALLRHHAAALRGAAYAMDITWQAQAATPDTRRLALLLGLIATEACIRGGGLAITVRPDMVDVSATGPRIIADSAWPALFAGEPPTDPRHVTAAMAWRTAQILHLRATVTYAEESLRLQTMHA